ncbi:MAG: hypothetical protein Q9222_000948 [Ikaeria aurantiellina]
MRIDKGNIHSLATIEQAAFVMCLDDGSPADASDRCNQFFLGDPSNRWSDKTLQFIVCENGSSAFVCEHAMLDGMSVRQFNRFITSAILQYNTDSTSMEDLTDYRDLVQEINFTLDPTIETQVVSVLEHFHATYAPIELVHHKVESPGAAFFRKHKFSAKSSYQAIIQLACLLYYGYQPESWETISMSRFHLGRVDWIQAVTPSMAQFCAAACDTSVPLAYKRKLFFEAVNNFANTMTQISRGHGFKAHMHALLAMVQEDETPPPLFQDKAWHDTAVASVKTVKTDCLEGAMLQETAFLMPEPKCIFLHYEVEEEG